jgi:hypothetical protein
VGEGAGENIFIYYFNSESLNCCGGRGEVFNLLAEFLIFQFLWGEEREKFLIY